MASSSPLVHAMSRIRSIGLALVVASLAGCSASDRDDEGRSSELVTRNPADAQMNDVSVLYPLAKTEAEMSGYVSASDQGRGGSMLPADLFESVLGATSRTPAGLIYARMKLVALRIDPCFAHIGPIRDGESCQNQLRVTFQQLDFEDGAATAVDGAVHAFYSLTREELTSLTRQLVALRRREAGETQLGPLAVHPILSTQGLLGGEAQGLREIILAHAGKPNLVRFTAFTPTSAAFRWDFFGFDVRDGALVPMVIPALQAGTTNVAFFAGFGNDFGGRFAPATTATDDMQLLGNLERARQASRAAQQAAVDAALRIENPNKHSADTIDCASCHAAGVTRVLTGGKLGLSVERSASLFRPDPRLVSASDMRQTTPVNDTSMLNVHAFSYRNTQPMIAARVINETAAVMTMMNGRILR